MRVRHCKLKKFIGLTLDYIRIHTYMAPIDYLSNEGLQKRFDDRTYEEILKSLEDNNYLSNDTISELLDIIKTVLVIDIPGEKVVQKDYTRYLDKENLMWVFADSKERNSVLQYIYNNTLLLLLILRKCFGNLDFIEAIENYLLQTDYFMKPHADINLDNIRMFVYMVYQKILTKCCRNVVTRSNSIVENDGVDSTDNTDNTSSDNEAVVNGKVSDKGIPCNEDEVNGKDVNQEIYRVMTTRFYSEVYLFISGYIIDNELEESCWIFGIRQCDRRSTEYFLSAEDRKTFKFYPDYKVALEKKIDALRAKDDEESIAEREELEYTYRLITLARSNVKYGMDYPKE